jgi:AcrR family transcriptional regulator
VQQAQRRAATRGRILQAAAALFARQGYADTSVQAIVRRARVAKGTFYQHFDSKLALFHVVGRRWLKETAEHTAAALAAGHPPVRVLRELVHDGCQWFADNPRLTEPIVLLAAMRDRDHPDADEGSHRQLFTLVLRAAQEAGEVRRDLPAEQMALGFGSLYVTALVSWATSPDRMDLHGLLDRMLELFLDGARTREGS